MSLLKCNYSNLRPLMRAQKSGQFEPIFHQSMGKEILTLEFLNFQWSTVIPSFYHSSSFLLLKRYLFFEDRLDWKPTSKMEKIQHALCSLRHSEQNWVRPRKNPNRWEKSFSSQSPSQTIAKYAKNASVNSKSMSSTRSTLRKWIKTNSLDTSKDLSKIFILSNKRASNEADQFVRKRRILMSLYNWESKRLSLANQNSELFQLLKSNLNWRKINFSEKDSLNGWKRIIHWRIRFFFQSIPTILIFFNYYFRFIFHFFYSFWIHMKLEWYYFEFSIKKVKSEPKRFEKCFAGK